MAERHAEKYCKEVLGYPASNMRYVEGHIEYLNKAGIADESVRHRPVTLGSGLRA